MTNLIGTFNAESRGIVSKFSGLWGFVLLENLYSREGSLEVNKTSKLEFKLKTVRFNFLSS